MGCVVESAGPPPTDLWVEPHPTAQSNEWLDEYQGFTFYASTHDDTCMMVSGDELYLIPCQIKDNKIKIGVTGSISWTYQDPCWIFWTNTSVPTFDGRHALMCPVGG